jgi:hypothetical protein
MVVRGQPKTQNPNESKGVQKLIMDYILKLIYLQKPSSKINHHLMVLKWQ